jgi:hypothetical protein
MNCLYGTNPIVGCCFPRVVMEQVVIRILPIVTRSVPAWNVVVRPAEVHAPLAQCFVRNAQWLSVEAKMPSRVRAWT